MLAGFLLHRITTMNAKRRITEENQEENLEKGDSEVHQSDICRTCLSKTNLRPIFCNSYDKQMTYKLKLTTSLEIKRDDDLPQQICSKCLRIINTSLNFRIKCKAAEEALLRMLKKNVKMEPTILAADNDFETESNLNKSTNPIAETIIRNIKIEFEEDRKATNIKVENSNDIKPNVPEIGRDIQSVFIDEKPMHTDETFLNKDLPIYSDKNIPTNYEKLSISGTNISTASEDNSSKTLKTPPKTSAERQKKYRERLKHQDSDKTQKILKKAERVTTQKKTVNTIQEPKLKTSPPRPLRARRFHSRQPVPGPPYKCETCDKEFLNKSTYITHTRMHTSYFVCEECGKQSPNNFSLQQHKRALHGLAKIHHCRYCDFSASNKDSLIVHERRHRGERPFVCDHCGGGFYSRRTLIQHIGVHLPDTIQCPHCPKRLRSLRLLSNHKAQKHGKRYSYQCPSCPKSFKDKKYVRRHLVGVHQMPREEHPAIEKSLLY